MALAACAGCASTADPEDFPAKAPTVVVTASTPISVEPILREQPASEFNLGITVLRVDLNAFSRRLADLLAESLKAAGVQLSGGRMIRVQVDHVDFMTNSGCLLDYRVVLGGAPAFGNQAVGTGAFFDRACGAAFGAAVSAIATDPRTLAYLAQR